MADFNKMAPEAKAPSLFARLFGHGLGELGGYGGPPPTDFAPIQPRSDPAEDVQIPIIGQEFGVSQESYYTRFELNQYTPDELVSKKGFKIFEKMYTDDQIHMAITAIKIMLLSAGFEIREASQDPQDLAIADFIADCFLKMETPLDDGLFNILGGLEMGWSINEKVLDFYEYGPWKGLVRLKALKSKNPRWFNPSVDDFNNITGVVSISPPIFGRKMPANKFLIYSFMKRYENVFGFSRLRSLYDWWWVKQVTRRALGVYLEKYGHPTPVGKYPIAMQKPHRDNFLAALQKMKVASAITIPDGTTIDYLEASKKGAESYLQTIEKCDQQIVKVIMGQTLSSGTSMNQAAGKGGSMGGHGGAGSNAQMDVLGMYLSFVGKHLANGPMALLIKELVDYNWMGVTNYPTFHFKPIAEEDLSSTVTTFISAATSGVVQLNPEDEERIREILQFPSKSSKSALRPSRYVNNVTLRPIQGLAINPLQMPWGGYRPATPSGENMPANYSESSRKIEEKRDPMPKPWRKLTRYEVKHNFAETWNITDTLGEDALSEQVARILRKAVEKLKVEAKKAVGDSGAIRKLSLPYRSELSQTLREGLHSVARRAIKQAQSEVEGHKKFADLDVLEPKEVLTFIKDKSFTMAGDISDEVLKKAKQAMYNGVKSGASYKDMVYAIEDAISPYIDLSQADKDLAEHRLETIIRTNVMEAYNEARKATFLEEELGGFVRAFQFSAILDDRTTDWCNALDGKIFKTSNPIWDKITPPTFYNCRSILIPITKVDDWDGEESETPGPDEMPPEDFK